MKVSILYIDSISIYTWILLLNSFSGSYVWFSMGSMSLCEGSWMVKWLNWLRGDVMKHDMTKKQHVANSQRWFILMFTSLKSWLPNYNWILKPRFLKSPHRLSCSSLGEGSLQMKLFPHKFLWFDYLRWNLMWPRTSLALLRHMLPRSSTRGYSMSWGSFFGSFPDFHVFPYMFSHSRGYRFRCRISSKGMSKLWWVVKPELFLGWFSVFG